MRGSCFIVIDRLVGNNHVDIRAGIIARIQVPIPKREVAAGYVYPDAVAFPEHVTGHLQVNRELVCGTGDQKLGRSPDIFTEACTDNALGDIDGAAIGVNICQLRHKVGVSCGRGRMERD